jgi:hypothetical protein
MFLLKEYFKEQASTLLWKKLIDLLDSHPVMTEHYYSTHTYFWHTKKINAQEAKLPYSNNIVFRLAIKTAEVLGELESEEIFEKAAKYCHNMFKKVVTKKEEDALYPCMWIVLAYSKNSTHRAIVNTIIKQLHFPKGKKGYQKISIALLVERDIRRQVLLSISKAWSKYPELPTEDVTCLLTVVKEDALVLETVLNDFLSLSDKWFSHIKMLNPDQKFWWKNGIHPETLEHSEIYYACNSTFPCIKDMALERLPIEKDPLKAERAVACLFLLLNREKDKVRQSKIRAILSKYPEESIKAGALFVRTHNRIYLTAKLTRF